MKADIRPGTARLKSRFARKKLKSERVHGIRGGSSLGIKGFVCFDKMLARDSVGVAPGMMGERREEREEDGEWGRRMTTTMETFPTL